MIIYTCEIQKNHKSQDTISLIEKFFSLYLPNTPCPKILRTDLGKPFLEDSRIHVGVTHAERRIFIGFANQNFGIDAEKNTRSVSRARQIAKKYFSDSENAYILQSSDFSDFRFLEIWVKKEALVKYKGDGLCGLSDSDVFSCGLEFSSITYNDFTLCVCAKNKEQLQIIQL